MEGHLFPVHLPCAMNDDQFFEFCQENRDVQIELTADGEILIMPPAGGETSVRNLDITFQFRAWAKKEGSGVAFGPDGGFTLPDGSMLSPDAAWVSKARLKELTLEQKQKFPPVCPDFVLELRSPSDRLAAVQNKMQKYLKNGARMGWLLDPRKRRVYIYRPDAAVQILEDPKTVAGDPVLPGFVLDLSEIWDTGI